MEQEKRLNLYTRKVIDRRTKPDGTLIIITKWFKEDKTISLGSLKKPNEEIVEFAYDY